MDVVIYSVACAEDRAGDPMIRACRDWLFDEVARERVGVEAISAAE